MRDAPYTYHPRTREFTGPDVLTIGVNTDFVRESAYFTLKLEAEGLKKENDFLRAYTSQSAKACVYCGLGADDMYKCAAGFPGCARGDDQMLCREVAVGMERDQLRKELDRLKPYITLADSLLICSGHGEPTEQDIKNVLMLIKNIPLAPPWGPG